MSKYIDADKIDWRLIISTNISTAEEHMLYKAQTLIDRQLAADVVEVVRCKDCENWDTPYCSVLDDVFDEDFFCALGERRKK